jgi:hypothetical protein
MLPSEVINADFTGRGKQPGEVTSPLEYGKDSTGHGNFTGRGKLPGEASNAGFTGQGKQKH